MEETARAHVIITGRVQGVFFRMETKRAADRIGVSGWVRNRPEGTVEAVFEGDKEKVEAAINWCRVGSPGSQVTDVAVTWKPFEGTHEHFEVTYF
ncbi:MAG: acylphosphatase [Desulfobacterales bacterium]|nr:acylphosphatase [Desulfobacterales bacterium]